MNMESDSENELLELTHDSTEVAKDTSINLLPEISRKKYESVYNLYMEWQNKHQITSFSENVLVAYFREISKKYKASTLWTQYSMLRPYIKNNNKVDIARFFKLRAFLKKLSDNHRPKKSKVFTSNEINRFIQEAPDEEYLLTKVALIMGVMGSCRMHELHQMTTRNFNDLGSAVLVTLQDAKTKTIRKFTITGLFYDIFKKYINVRPPNVNNCSFFLNYRKGKCTMQNVGINQFGSMGKQMAKCLRLPNPELYTGHSFRKSVLVEDGGYVTSIKRHGGWKYTKILPKEMIDQSVGKQFDQVIVTEGSVDQPMETKVDETIETTFNRAPSSGRTM